MLNDEEEYAFNALTSDGEPVFYTESATVKIYTGGKRRLELVKEIFEWVDNNGYEVDLLGGHDAGDGLGYFYRWGIRDAKQRMFFLLTWQ